MSLRINSKNIELIRGRELFFDANVLVYLFGPVQPNSQWGASYSTLLSKCLNMRISLYFDVIILSEFINRFLQLELHRYNEVQNKSRNINIKEFRALPDGKKVISDIEFVVKERLLRDFKLAEKTFLKSDIDAMSLQTKDFNDHLIINICKTFGYVLVTNDKDFSGVDIDIVTENNKLR